MSFLVLNFDRFIIMTPKILLQDSNYDEWCEQEILNAYKEAAECDEYLFGDYDYCKEWINIID
jgi:BioD-like phosphotransacetylase family protein